MANITFAPGVEELIRLLDMPAQQPRREFPLAGGEWWYAHNDEGYMSHGGDTAYDALLEALTEVAATDNAVSNWSPEVDAKIPTGTVWITYATQESHTLDGIAQRMVDWVADNAEDRYSFASSEFGYLDDASPEKIERLQKVLEPVLLDFFEREHIHTPRWFDETRREVEVDFTIDVRPGDEHKDTDAIVVTAARPRSQGWAIEDLRAQPKLQELEAIAAVLRNENDEHTWTDQHGEWVSVRKIREIIACTCDPAEVDGGHELSCPVIVTWPKPG